MTRSRKPDGPGSGRDEPPEYTDQQKKTHAFANARRTVKTDGVSEKLSNHEIMERKQFESGIKGNSVSQRDYLRRSELADSSRRAYVDRQCAGWEMVKARHQEIIDQAAAAKTPIPRVLPHPGDIIIDPQSGVRIIGPLDEDDWKRFYGQVLFRDALYLQQAMEDAGAGVRVEDRPTSGAALVLAMLTNKRLPPSLRMSDAAQGVHIVRLMRLSKREALLECRAAWKAIGASAARGKRFGTLATLRPLLDALHHLEAAFKTIEEDPLDYQESLQIAVEATRSFAASAPKPGTKTRRKPAGALEPEPVGSFA